MSDYFQIFSIDRSFGVEPEQLERRFHELQGEAHPDRHVNASAEKRAKVLSDSSEINRAYRTLRNPMARAKYLLSLYGYSMGDQKRVPPSLLMTVMEAQESIAELETMRDPARKQTVLHQLTAIAEQLDMRRISLEAEMARIAREWDTNLHPATESELSDVEREQLGRIGQILAELAYIETLHLSVRAAREGRPAIIKH